MLISGFYPWEREILVWHAQSTKCAVGRLRPDFLDRCKPLGGPDYKFHTQYGQNTAVVCTETDINLLDDGRSSFPSGVHPVLMCLALLRVETSEGR